MTEHLTHFERIARRVLDRPIRDKDAFRKAVMEAAGRITTNDEIPPPIRQQIRDAAMCLMRRFEEGGAEALATIERVKEQLSGRGDA